MRSGVVQGTENDAQIEKRLHTAQTELAFCDSEEGKATFDAVIVNDDLESAFAEFCAAIL